MSLRILLSLLLVLAVSLASLPTASANAQVDYTVFRDVTETAPIIESCTETRGELTVTYDGFVVTNVDDQGGFHSSTTKHGVFSFVPEDPSKPAYTGRFFEQFTVYHSSVTFPESTYAATLILMGTGSDGSVLSFRTIDHEVGNPNGLPVNLEYLWCSGLRIAGETPP